MQILAYSTKRLEGKKVAETLVSLVSPHIDPDRLKMTKPSGEVIGFELETFSYELENSSSSGFFLDEKVVFSVDYSEFMIKYKKYPCVKLELNLYHVSDLSSILDAMKMLVLSLDIDLSFVLANEAFIAEYNSSDISIGIGLVDVYWINYYGRLFDEVLKLNRDGSPFYLNERVEENRGRLLVTKQSYAAHLSANDVQNYAMKSFIGSDYFTTYKCKHDKRGAGESWALSPKNLIKFWNFVASAAVRGSFEGQAAIVPFYFRETNPLSNQ